MARTGVVLGSLFLGALVASVAFADGMFVWRNRDADIVEPEQKALILFDHGLEDLVLEVRFSGAPRDFGWIVPLPARPRMRADDPELFTHLSMATQEAYAPSSERTARHFQSLAASASEVRVLERARVGIFDAAVIEGGDGSALQGWLVANRFHPPRGGEAILGEYARRGWVFVALRITPARADSATARALAEGTVQPVRFRFATPEPVFPLRISAAGGTRATVLLYVISRTALRHRTCDRAKWDERACRSTPRWIWTLDPDSTYRELAAGGQLTKLRAEVAADAMEDVYFRPFDPWPGLASPDERTRLESIRLLGETRADGAARRLSELLATSGRAQRESIAVLWALGRLDGEEAVRTLVRFTGLGSDMVRLEAIESLVRRRAPEVLPVLARGIVAMPRREYDTVMSDACTEHLVAWGDRRALGLLREFEGLPPPSPPRYPSLLDGPSTADRLWAARAACGDQVARDSIVERIVRESGIADADVMERSVRRYSRGITNGFPMGFWLGHQLLFRFGSPSPWASLATWEHLLEPSAAVHDEVLRRVAADPRVPPLGRILTLGLLTDARTQDADDVRTLAMLPLPGRTTPLVLTLQAGMSGERATRYDVQLCSAAYALRRMRAESQLLSLWEHCGGGDFDTRSTVASALAGFHSRRSDAALAGFVRDDWQARLSSPPNRESSEPSIPGRRLGRSVPGDLGLEGWVQTITSALGSESPDTTWMRGLTTDPALSPRFRLFWMSQLPGYQSRWRPLVADLRRDLAKLEQSSDADSALRHVIAGIRKHFDICDQTYESSVRPRTSLVWR